MLGYRAGFSERAVFGFCARPSTVSTVKLSMAKQLSMVLASLGFALLFCSGAAQQIFRTNFAVFSRAVASRPLFSFLRSCRIQFLVLSACCSVCNAFASVLP